METLFYYLLAIAFGMVAFTFGVFVILKHPNFRRKFFIILSLVFASLFIYRYMSGEDIVSYTFKLDGVFDNKAQNFFAVILVWFTYASNLLICTYAFFNIKRLNKYIKFICFPVVIANILFLNFHFTSILGISGANSISFRGVIFALEIGLALFYVVLMLISPIKYQAGQIDTSTQDVLDDALLYKKELPKNKIKAVLTKLGRFFLRVWGATTKFFKKYWFGIFAILAIFISTMPSYTLQAIFGHVNQVYKVKSFEIPHRILIYIGIILPFIIHFSLKNKEYKEKRFYLLMICLGTLLTYSFTKKFVDFADLTLWPLHLCNTAMYIMPIVLIFNMKRFFYFTYFINVIGAFFAMMIPNYTATSNIISQSIVNFYVNHYIAFFMPILFVSLGMFQRPKFKQFVYSMIGFAAYFVTVIVINSAFTGLFNIGAVERTTDFFFVNSDFIAEKLGQWAENLRNITAVVHVGRIDMTFYPVYQILFFLAYVVLGLGVWFVYAQGYEIAWGLEDIRNRKRKIRQDEIALMAKVNGRSIMEPVNPQNGNKLILRHFSKKYGTSDVFAVEDANLEVSGGEIFGFLGPNGAGKSTIIKTVVGIQPITSGEIEVCGYDAETQGIEARRNIGFVPDHYALYEKLTGREYINYIADLYSVSLEDRNKRIDRYVKRFELEGAFDNQMKTYSHGMKQKIAIMAALVHDPKVWILDEPLTGLDPNSIFQVKECMKERAREGNIVFFSSHIIDVVERICDKIAIIKKGHILLTKTVKEIEDSGETLENFYMRTINGENYKLTSENWLLFKS